ncbi:ABC1 kinase family protein [Eikenella corrodens]|uniref:ABC1 kinase family protein n=1 Tax=Eikenella corrodens TaxID=539 RepID=UPI0007D0A217|nr:AarF/UbiB family protein [Eikenella corrodens]OAM31735.1 ubiquinone biosynthesis protein [Eikenella corrodens]
MVRSALPALGDINRLRQIVATLARHGLGGFLSRIKLNRASWLGGSAAQEDAGGLSTAHRFRLAFEELGPTFIKLGQILATRVDIFNAEWIEEFEHLQSGANPLPFEAILSLLTEQLGCPPEQVFQHIDSEPLGSASIAQVHRAVLFDGSEVAVKVRRPDIEPLIRADLRILTHLAQLTESEMPETRRYQPVQMVQYFAKSLARETDLLAEMRHLQRFASLYANHPAVHIPKVYPEYSNRQVLVQEYVAATLLKDTNIELLGAEERHILACRITDVLLDMILGQGLFHADPHPGNIFIYPNLRIGLIDFGMTGYLNPVRRQEINALIEALIHRDSFAVQYILSNWAQGDIPDEDLLGADVMEMLLDYEHIAVRDLRVSQVINDLTRIMREHELALPGDLVMLFKALLTLEGVVKRLDGSFQLLEHAKPIVQKVIRQRLSLQQLWRRSRTQSRMLGQMLGELPKNLLRLNRNLQSGRLNVNLDLKRLDSLNRHLEYSANRLTMGMVTAALIIGSSILLSSNIGPKLFGLSFVGFLGYLLAFANSLWIIWSIWRSGKH